MDWTPSMDAELARLWAEGHTGSEIGRRMGKTKSSVVGRVHRLHLPGRPSPINRNGPKASGFTPDPAKTVTSPSIRGRCNWPLWGDTEKPTHEYCGHDTAPGSNYCSHHHAVSYTAAKPAGGAAAYFSKINNQSGSPYGAQDMGPVKAKGAA